MSAESRIEKAVSDYAKKKLFYVRKFKSPSNRGVPDKLFISLKGDVFFIEFKAPNGKPSSMQIDEIDQITKRKGKAYIIDSVEEGKELIDKYGI